jgi:hypothetical protein
MPIHPAIAIRILVTQQARREVKDRLWRQGIKISGMSARELNAPAEEHLRANAPDLLKTVETRCAPLLAQWRAEWQRHQERRSRRACKSPK